MRFTSIRDDDGAEPWGKLVALEPASRVADHGGGEDDGLVMGSWWSEHDLVFGEGASPEQSTTRPWATSESLHGHWSRDVKKLSSGLETKKNESELKLVEVRSGLAKRVNEVATSWASAGAATGSGDVTPLGKTLIR